MKFTKFSGSSVDEQLPWLESEPLSILYVSGSVKFSWYLYSHHIAYQIIFIKLTYNDDTSIPYCYKHNVTAYIHQLGLTEFHKLVLVVQLQLLLWQLQCCQLAILSHLLLASPILVYSVQKFLCILGELTFWCEEYRHHPPTTGHQSLVTFFLTLMFVRDCLEKKYFICCKKNITFADIILVLQCNSKLNFMNLFCVTVEKLLADNFSLSWFWRLRV